MWRNAIFFYSTDPPLQGTDITEAYETHHFNFDKTNAILQKYHVRKAALPRNMKLTFEENGFYKTLKRRVVDKLNETNVKRTNYLSNVSFLKEIIVDY